MTFKMGDTLGGSIGSLPRGLAAYASYVDNYGGFPELQQWASGSGAALLSITIFGNRAQCGDFESGAMVNSQAGGWLDHVAEPNPILYTFASNSQALLDAAGRRKFQLWSAHVAGEHICGPSTCGYPKASATQYVFNPGGLNIDLSVCEDDFLHRGPPPPPPDPHGYQRFMNDKWQTRWGYIRERDVVLHYDGARKHPFLHRNLLNHDLRPKLHYLADRVWAIAHSQPQPDGSPSWGLFDRGWRYQMLRHRADGERFA